MDKDEDIEIVPNYDKESLHKLRAIQPDDPNIENLWRETFTARNRKTTIFNYYSEYPILKTSIGAVLVITQSLKCTITYLGIFYKLLSIIAVTN